ncbi:MAG: hypothetical protein ACXV5H_12335 [Halobacteriota archaeon]
MKTDRPRCSVCGDYDLMKGWVLSYHELYCVRCAIKKLVESSSSIVILLPTPKI